MVDQFQTKLVLDVVDDRGGNFKKCLCTQKCRHDDKFKGHSSQILNQMRPICSGPTDRIDRVFPTSRTLIQVPMDFFNYFRKHWRSQPRSLVRKTLSQRFPSLPEPPSPQGGLEGPPPSLDPPSYKNGKLVIVCKCGRLRRDRYVSIPSDRTLSDTLNLSVRAFKGFIPRGHLAVLAVEMSDETYDYGCRPEDNAEFQDLYRRGCRMWRLLPSDVPQGPPPPLLDWPPYRDGELIIVCECGHLRRDCYASIPSDRTLSDTVNLSIRAFKGFIPRGHLAVVAVEISDETHDYGCRPEDNAKFQDLCRRGCRMWRLLPNTSLLDLPPFRDGELIIVCECGHLCQDRYASIPSDQTLSDTVSLSIRAFKGFIPRGHLAILAVEMSDETHDYGRRPENNAEFQDLCRRGCHMWRLSMENRKNVLQGPPPPSLDALPYKNEELMIVCKCGDLRQDHYTGIPPDRTFSDTQSIYLDI